MVAKVFWKLKLENDVFAQKHIWHVLLLATLELVFHIVLRPVVPDIFSFYPLTQILTLLIYRKTHEATQRQARLIVKTTLIGTLLAIIVTLFLREAVWTLPLVFLLLICFLYVSGLPFYVTAAGILIIFSYFAQQSWMWFVFLYIDVVFFTFLALLLSRAFNVTSWDNFRENYQKLRYDFNQLKEQILNDQLVDTTNYFQRILRLENILQAIHAEHCLDAARYGKLVDILREVYETYFYLRALNGKQVEDDEIYAFHLQKMEVHLQRWIILEDELSQEGVPLE